MFSHDFKTAFVNVGIAPLRAEPSSRSEMMSQAILWTPMTIHATRPKWLQVEMPDGYLGWIESNRLCFDVPENLLSLPKKFYRPLWGFARQEPVADAAAAREIVRGTMLPHSPETDSDHWHAVFFPDQHRAYIRKDDLQGAVEVARADLIITAARECLGISYLWGGATPKGFDCSGLVQAVFSWHGLQLPRDSYQQAESGHPVEIGSSFATIQPADLLFFENDSGRIVHVAISLGTDLFIHAGKWVEIQSLSDLHTDLRLCRIRRVVPSGPAFSPAGS